MSGGIQGRTPIEVPETPPVDPSVARMSQAARRWAGDSTPAPPSARWGRLQIERARRARRTRRRLMALAVALPLLVVAAWGVRGRFPRQVLSYRLDGTAAVGEGGYIHDIGAAGARLRFSDGTAIDLASGARAWIVSRGPDGARLRLEGGRARFDVVHRPDARWSVAAGPFAVEVTGTAFAVSWSGGDEELEVNLWRGAVEVRGPLLERGVMLRPGQRLRIGVRDKSLDLAQGPDTPRAGGDPPPFGREPPAAAPEATGAGAPTMPAAGAPSLDKEPRAPAQSPERPPRAPAGAARARPAHAQRTDVAAFSAPPPGHASWPARVAAGDFRAVLAEAQAAGLDRCASACTVSALSALADAARYAGRAALARDLLLAERERFPDQPSARTAAFLLGRLADDDRASRRAGGASISEAIEWYDRYLGEAPGGAYAAEALARKMLAVEALGDGPRARRLAEDYLRRFPTGAYAPQAAALLRRP